MKGMSDSMKDLLQKRSSNEPPEFQVIREYMQGQLKCLPKLSLSNKNIVIQVPNAAIAGSLRLVLHELASLCNTKSKLIIRIG